MLNSSTGLGPLSPEVRPIPEAFGSCALQIVHILRLSYLKTGRYIQEMYPVDRLSYECFQTYAMKVLQACLYKSVNTGASFIIASSHKYCPNQYAHACFHFFNTKYLRHRA